MSEKQTENFFDGKGFDWESYMTHRPTYSGGFYDIIFDYHQAKGGNWELAHDIGTGPGNVAEVVAKRFGKVIASDLSADHIAFARNRAAALRSMRNVTFERARAEDLTSLNGVTVNSVDLITVAKCIPLMDAKAAVSGFANVLKPGGTLAIWFYGRPIFAEEGMEQIQKFYDRLLARAYDKARPFKGTSYERAWNMLIVWLDNVGFPSSEWEKVKRMKWNNDRELSFLLVEKIDDYEIDLHSEVTDREEIEEKVDRTFWVQDSDIQWIRGQVEMALPWARKDEKVEADLEKMFTELGEYMGPKGAKRKITWPVVLLLATKK